MPHGCDTAIFFCARPFPHVAAQASLQIEIPKADTIAGNS